MKIGDNMKRVFKSNLFWFIIGALIFGIGGVIAATAINAREITYRDTNVESALNDLYNKTLFSESFSESGLQTYGSSWTPSVTVEAGVNHVVLYITVTSNYGDTRPTISGSIIQESEITVVGNPSISGATGAGVYKASITTTGEAGTISVSASGGGSNSAHKYTVTMVAIKSNR